MDKGKQTYPENPSEAGSYRPIKIILPADLVKRMDALIAQGAGGFGHRHEFAQEALASYITDLEFAGVAENGEGDDVEYGAQAPDDGRGDPDEEGGDRGNVLAEISRYMKGPGGRRDAMGEWRLAVPMTKAIPPDEPQTPVPVRNQLAKIVSEPMFGLHNRDLPTLYALWQLARRRLAAELPALRAFYEECSTAAAGVARDLSEHLAASTPKITALWPTNRRRMDSARATFEAFAMGTVASRPDPRGLLLASGPFYAWGVAGLVPGGGADSDPRIGPTEVGLELLEALDGVRFAVPHAPEHAEAFLSFLGRHAPSDAWGFVNVLEALEAGADRQGLTRAFERGLAADFPEREWKTSVADSVAQGYLGRAREWGLVDPRRGRYEATPLGTEQLKRMRNDPATTQRPGSH